MFGLAAGCLVAVLTGEAPPAMEARAGGREMLPLVGVKLEGRGRGGKEGEMREREREET